MRDDRVGHALFADQRRQRARVDAGQRDDAAPLQPLVEMAGGAIVGRIGDVGLEDRADRAGAGRRVEVFDVLVIGADIADMRKGEGDDLAGIGRVGEDFLIAGQRRVEADFGDRAAGGAEAAAFDHRAVGQHQQRRSALGLPRVRSQRSSVSPSEVGACQGARMAICAANGAAAYRDLAWDQYDVPCKARLIGDGAGAVNDAAICQPI